YGIVSRDGFVTARTPQIAQAAEFLENAGVADVQAIDLAKIINHGFPIQVMHHIQMRRMMIEQYKLARCHVFAFFGLNAQLRSYRLELNEKVSVLDILTPEAYTRLGQNRQGLRGWIKKTEIKDRKDAADQWVMSGEIQALEQRVNDTVLLRLVPALEGQGGLYAVYAQTARALSTSDRMPVSMRHGVSYDTIFFVRALMHKISDSGLRILKDDHTPDEEFKVWIENGKVKAKDRDGKEFVEDLPSLVRPGMIGFLMVFLSTLFWGIGFLALVFYFIRVGFYSLVFNKSSRREFREANPRQKGFFAIQFWVTMLRVFFKVRLTKMRQLAENRQKQMLLQAGTNESEVHLLEARLAQHTASTERWTHWRPWRRPSVQATQRRLVDARERLDASRTQQNDLESTSQQLGEVLEAHGDDVLALIAAWWHFRGQIQHDLGYRNGLVRALRSLGGFLYFLWDYLPTILFAIFYLFWLGNIFTLQVGLMGLITGVSVTLAILFMNYILHKWWRSIRETVVHLVFLLQGISLRNPVAYFLFVVPAVAFYALISFGLIYMAFTAVAMTAIFVWAQVRQHGTIAFLFPARDREIRKNVRRINEIYYQSVSAQFSRSAFLLVMKSTLTLFALSYIFYTVSFLSTIMFFAALTACILCMINLGIAQLLTTSTLEMTKRLMGVRLYEAEQDEVLTAIMKQGRTGFGRNSGVIHVWNGLTDTIGEITMGLRNLSATVRSDVMRNPATGQPADRDRLGNIIGSDRKEDRLWMTYLMMINIMEDGADRHGIYSRNNYATLQTAHGAKWGGLQNFYERLRFDTLLNIAYTGQPHDMRNHVAVPRPEAGVTAPAEGNILMSQNMTTDYADGSWVDPSTHDSMVTLTTDPETGEPIRVRDVPRLNLPTWPGIAKAGDDDGFDFNPDAGMRAATYDQEQYRDLKRAAGNLRKLQAQRQIIIELDALRYAMQRGTITPEQAQERLNAVLRNLAAEFGLSDAASRSLGADRAIAGRVQYMRGYARTQLHDYMDYFSQEQQFTRPDGTVVVYPVSIPHAAAITELEQNMDRCVRDLNALRGPGRRLTPAAVDQIRTGGIFDPRGTIQGFRLEDYLSDLTRALEPLGFIDLANHGRISGVLDWFGREYRSAGDQPVLFAAVPETRTDPIRDQLRDLIEVRLQLRVYFVDAYNPENRFLISGGNLYASVPAEGRYHPRTAPHPGFRSAIQGLESLHARLVRGDDLSLDEIEQAVSQMNVVMSGLEYLGTNERSRIQTMMADFEGVVEPLSRSENRTQAEQAAEVLAGMHALLQEAARKNQVFLWRRVLDKEEFNFRHQHIMSSEEGQMNEFVDLIVPGPAGRHFPTKVRMEVDERILLRNGDYFHINPFHGVTYAVKPDGTAVPIADHSKVDRMIRYAMRYTDDERDGYADFVPTLEVQSSSEYEVIGHQPMLLVMAPNTLGSDNVGARVGKGDLVFGVDAVKEKVGAGGIDIPMSRGAFVRFKGPQVLAEFPFVGEIKYKIHMTQGDALRKISKIDKKKPPTPMGLLYWHIRDGIPMHQITRDFDLMAQVRIAGIPAGQPQPYEELAAQIRDVVGPDFRIGTRLTASQHDTIKRLVRRFLHPRGMSQADRDARKQAFVAALGYHADYAAMNDAVFVEFFMNVIAGDGLLTEYTVDNDFETLAQIQMGVAPEPFDQLAQAIRRVVGPGCAPGMRISQDQYDAVRGLVSSFFTDRGLTQAARRSRRQAFIEAVMHDPAYAGYFEDRNGQFLLADDRFVNFVMLRILGQGAGSSYELTNADYDRIHRAAGRFFSGASPALRSEPSEKGNRGTARREALLGLLGYRAKFAHSRYWDVGEFDNFVTDLLVSLDLYEDEKGETPGKLYRRGMRIATAADLDRRGLRESAKGVFIDIDGEVFIDGVRVANERDVGEDDSPLGIELSVTDWKGQFLRVNGKILGAERFKKVKTANGEEVWTIVPKEEGEPRQALLIRGHYRDGVDKRRGPTDLILKLEMQDAYPILARKMMGLEGAQQLEEYGLFPHPSMIDASKSGREEQFLVDNPLPSMLRTPDGAYVVTGEDVDEVGEFDEDGKTLRLHADPDMEVAERGSFERAGYAEVEINERGELVMSDDPEAVVLPAEALVRSDTFPEALMASGAMQLPQTRLAVSADGTVQIVIARTYRTPRNANTARPRWVFNTRTMATFTGTAADTITIGGVDFDVQIAADGHTQLVNPRGRVYDVDRQHIVEIGGYRFHAERSRSGILQLTQLPLEWNASMASSDLTVDPRTRNLVDAAGQIIARPGQFEEAGLEDWIVIAEGEAINVEHVHDGDLVIVDHDLVHRDPELRVNHAVSPYEPGRTVSVVKRGQFRNARPQLAILTYEDRLGVDKLRELQAKLADYAAKSKGTFKSKRGFLTEDTAQLAEAAERRGFGATENSPEFRDEWGDYAPNDVAYVTQLREMLQRVDNIDADDAVRIEDTLVIIERRTNYMKGSGAITADDLQKISDGTHAIRDLLGTPNFVVVRSEARTLEQEAKLKKIRDLVSREYNRIGRGQFVIRQGRKYSDHYYHPVFPAEVTTPERAPVQPVYYVRAPWTAWAREAGENRSQLLLNAKDGFYQENGQVYFHDRKRMGKGQGPLQLTFLGQRRVQETAQSEIFLDEASGRMMETYRLAKENTYFVWRDEDGKVVGWTEYAKVGRLNPRTGVPEMFTGNTLPNGENEMRPLTPAEQDEYETEYAIDEDGFIRSKDLGHVDPVTHLSDVIHNTVDPKFQSDEYVVGVGPKRGDLVALRVYAYKGEYTVNADATITSHSRRRFVELPDPADATGERQVLTQADLIGDMDHIMPVFEDKQLVGYRNRKVVGHVDTARKTVKIYVRDDVGSFTGAVPVYPEGVVPPVRDHIVIVDKGVKTDLSPDESQEIVDGTHPLYYLDRGRVYRRQKTVREYTWAQFDSEMVRQGYFIDDVGRVYNRNDGEEYVEEDDHRQEIQDMRDAGYYVISVPEPEQGKYRMWKVKVVAQHGDYELPDPENSNQVYIRSQNKIIRLEDSEVEPGKADSDVRKYYGPILIDPVTREPLMDHDGLPIEPSQMPPVGNQTDGDDVYTSGRKNALTLMRSKADGLIRGRGQAAGQAQGKISFQNTFETSFARGNRDAQDQLTHNVLQLHATWREQNPWGKMTVTWFAVGRPDRLVLFEFDNLNVSGLGPQPINDLRALMVMERGERAIRDAVLARSEVRADLSAQTRAYLRQQQDIQTQYAGDMRIATIGEGLRDVLRKTPIIPDAQGYPENVIIRESVFAHARSHDHWEGMSVLSVLVPGIEAKQLYWSRGFRTEIDDLVNRLKTAHPEWVDRQGRLDLRGRVRVGAGQTLRDVLIAEIETATHDPAHPERTYFRRTADGTMVPRWGAGSVALRNDRERLAYLRNFATLDPLYEDVTATFWEFVIKNGSWMLGDLILITAENEFVGAGMNVARGRERSIVNALARPHELPAQHAMTMSLIYLGNFGAILFALLMVLGMMATMAPGLLTTQAVFIGVPSGALSNAAMSVVTALPVGQLQYLGILIGLIIIPAVSTPIVQVITTDNLRAVSEGDHAYTGVIPILRNFWRLGVWGAPFVALAVWLVPYVLPGLLNAVLTWFQLEMTVGFYSWWFTPLLAIWTGMVYWVAARTPGWVRPEIRPTGAAVTVARVAPAPVPTRVRFYEFWKKLKNPLLFAVVLALAIYLMVHYAPFLDLVYQNMWSWIRSHSWFQWMGDWRDVWGQELSARMFLVKALYFLTRYAVPFYAVFKVVSSPTWVGREIVRKSERAVREKTNSTAVLLNFMTIATQQLIRNITPIIRGVPPVWLRLAAAKVFIAVIPPSLARTYGLGRRDQTDFLEGTHRVYFIATFIGVTVLLLCQFGILDPAYKYMGWPIFILAFIFGPGRAFIMSRYGHERFFKTLEDKATEEYFHSWQRLRTLALYRQLRQLRGDIARRQQELDELIATVGAGDPRVPPLRDELAALRARADELQTHIDEFRKVRWEDLRRELRVQFELCRDEIGEMQRTRTVLHAMLTPEFVLDYDTAGEPIIMGNVERAFNFLLISVFRRLEQRGDVQDAMDTHGREWKTLGYQYQMEVMSDLYEESRHLPQFRGRPSLRPQGWLGLKIRRGLLWIIETAVVPHRVIFLIPNALAALAAWTSGGILRLRPVQRIGRWFQGESWDELFEQEREYDEALGVAFAEGHFDESYMEMIQAYDAAVFEMRPPTLGRDLLVILGWILQKPLAALGVVFRVMYYLFSNFIASPLRYLTGFAGGVLVIGTVLYIAFGFWPALIICGIYFGVLVALRLMRLIPSISLSFADGDFRRSWSDAIYVQPWYRSIFYLLQMGVQFFAWLPYMVFAALARVSEMTYGYLENHPFQTWRNPWFFSGLRDWEKQDSSGKIAKIRGVVDRYVGVIDPLRDETLEGLQHRPGAMRQFLSRPMFPALERNDPQMAGVGPILDDDEHLRPQLAHFVDILRDPDNEITGRYLPEHLRANPWQATVADVMRAATMKSILDMADVEPDEAALDHEAQTYSERSGVGELLDADHATEPDSIQIAIDALAVTVAGARDWAADADHAANQATAEANNDPANAEAAAAANAARVAAIAASVAANAARAVADAIENHADDATLIAALDQAARAASDAQTAAENARVAAGLVVRNDLVRDAVINAADAANLAAISTAISEAIGRAIHDGNMPNLIRAIDSMVPIAIAHNAPAIRAAATDADQAANRVEAEAAANPANTQMQAAARAARVASDAAGSAADAARDLATAIARNAVPAAIDAAAEAAVRLANQARMAARDARVAMTWFAATATMPVNLKGAADATDLAAELIIGCTELHGRVTALAARTAGVWPGVVARLQEAEHWVVAEGESVTNLNRMRLVAALKAFGRRMAANPRAIVEDREAFEREREAAIREAIWGDTPWQGRLGSRLDIVRRGGRLLGQGFCRVTGSFGYDQKVENEDLIRNVLDQMFAAEQVYVEATRSETRRLPEVIAKMAGSKAAQASGLELVGDALYALAGDAMALEELAKVREGSPLPPRVEQMMLQASPSQKAVFRKLLDVLIGDARFDAARTAFLRATPEERHDGIDLVIAADTFYEQAIDDGALELLRFMGGSNQVFEGIINNLRGVIPDRGRRKPLSDAWTELVSGKQSRKLRIQLAKLKPGDAIPKDILSCLKSSDAKDANSVIFRKMLVRLVNDERPSVVKAKHDYIEMTRSEVRIEPEVTGKIGDEELSRLAQALGVPETSRLQEMLKELAGASGNRVESAFQEAIDQAYGREMERLNQPTVSTLAMSEKKFKVVEGNAIYGRGEELVSYLEMTLAKMGENDTLVYFDMQMTAAERKDIQSRFDRNRVYIPETTPYASFNEFITGYAKGVSDMLL
ncbi:MAG: hypothetical protein PHN49_04000, partial [Candidatus Omnitrophica bacterium]|nr:hypothetical protein [Candidatus Omnitrophota bacterium]